MVKVWLAPWATVTAPLGLMEPLAPALAVMVKLLEVALAGTLAQYVDQRLPFEPVAPSSVLTRFLAYSWMVHREASSEGSTWQVLKSPQRLRPLPKSLW